jgi:DNA phosphorothioation-dependent restriction protein DptH
MSTSTQLYRLDEAALVNEYVDALFGELKGFLRTKNPGHCQRIDYLPRAVVQRLGERLAVDGDLTSEKIVCRVITDTPQTKTIKAWEATGSGAVAFREDATYGRIKAFCALFPAGLRLAEEDSLNVATFKTDDALSFNVKKCLERHVWAKVNQLPLEEREILSEILKHEVVRSLDVQLKLRYVLSVLGQRDASGQPVNWETVGAYLYELRMIPDFVLELSSLSVQLTRNSFCAGVLADGEKILTQNLDRLVMEKGLDDEELRRELAVYLADKNTIRPNEWLPDICHDGIVRDKLSFDVWKFSEPTKGISLELKPLQDPKTPTKVASGLVFQNGALTNDGKKPIEIKWTVHPAGTTEIGGYRVYVLRTTEEEGEVDVITPQAVPAKRKSFSVPVADNFLDEDEKCVARIRIQAVNKSGIPIPGAVDESEEFWIENGQEITETPADRGKRIRHLREISFRATYKSGKKYDVRSRGWDAKRDYVYSLRLTNNDRGDLALNPLLRDLEWQILQNPNTLGAYEANVVGRRSATLADFVPVTLSKSVNQLANDFYEARKAFFKAICDLDDGAGVIEVADLHSVADEALIYVQKYVALLQALQQKVLGNSGPGAINNLLHDYDAIMRIDTIFMRVGPHEAPMEVLLLAPTHPLRVLWLYQYETFVDGWISQMDGRKPDEITQLISEDSIDMLLNLNIPNAISWAQGQTFINTDNLDLFWSVLPNARVSDLRTAVNATRQALGASRQTVIVSTVTPAQIADKIERYLCHHPYVQTLKINVINPGDGLLLLEAIKSLLAKAPYENLNFDLTFFAPDGTRHELVGNAFDDFMMIGQTGDLSAGGSLSESEEKLLQPNENPLFPKLVYAKHKVGELLGDESNRFESHLTFLIDYFGITIASRPHSEPTGSSSLHNLLAEYVTDYAAGASTATWSRLIAPNQCPDLASDMVTKKLYEAHLGISHLAACFCDWANSLDKFVTVQLELSDAGGKNHLKLLRRIHLISDWVFTIDRNFGIEYYDDPTNPSGSESRGYLIDYTPEFLDAVAHRLIISTYHQQEIESILKFGFSSLLASDPDEDVGIDSYTVGRIMYVLKSVSGKLALKLINNPNQAQEVIGLALARLALEKDGRLAGKVLIPVDSHIDLFFQSGKELENGDLTLKRTDLMLIELSDRKLHVDLIEVKNRRHSSPQELLDLQGQISEKNKNSEEHFRAYFVGAGKTKRFDADIKNKQLANILGFYLQRARRYGLFASAEAEVDPVGKFLKGIEAVEAGACDVSFSHEGYIFNGASITGEEVRSYQDNQIRIVGRAGISQLLGLILNDTDDDEEPEAPTPPPSESGKPKSELPQPQSTQSPVETPSPAPVAANGTENPEGLGQLPKQPPPLSQPSGPKPPPQPNVSPVDLEVNIHLGTDCVKGTQLYWNPQTKTPRRLTNQHLLVVGKSGSGKSETTKALIWELDRISVPSIILDYQGEYASGEFADAVQPRVFNVMAGLPINPFELPLDPLTGKKRPPIEMVFRIADTLNTVFSGSGDIQLGILREAIEQSYRQCGFDFHNEATWDNAPPTLDVLEVVLDLMAQDHGAQVRNLQVRLQPLFKSGIFRTEGVAFAFDELFEQTSVILMTSGIRDLMLAASRFILEKIYSAMLMKGVAKQLKLMVVIDEAHKLCGDETIISLVKEARKYGLGLILSSQETRDFHPSVFANTGTLIALGLEDADATVMAKHLGLIDKKQQAAAKELILCQSCGQALIRSQHFQPYSQVQIRSFEDRVEEAGPAARRPKQSNSYGHRNSDPQKPQVELFHGYRLTTPLFSGGMAEAYIAHRVSDGEQVFVKRVRVQSRDKEALEREAGIYERLLRFDSPHVAKVLEFLRDSEHVALVTECADGGDLQSYVEREGRGGGLSPAAAKLIALELATALKEFHGHDVIHRDLKPQNVLRFGSIWKLADFGIAKNVARLVTQRTFQQHGTLGYAAPEQFQGVEAHSSADIYSFGKILVFLLTGQTDVDFVQFTRWSSLIKRCISHAPQERPTMEDVIQILVEIPT